MTSDPEPFDIRDLTLGERVAYKIYKERLARSSLIIQPQAHVVQRQYVYGEMRRALVAFGAFARAVERVLGYATCQALLPDFDYWYGAAQTDGAVHALLSTACDVCGLLLTGEDLLGRVMYAAGPYAHTCESCADFVLTGYPHMSRRFARLRAFAQQRPDRLAAVVVAALERRRWDVSNAEQDLELDDVQFLTLVLADRRLTADLAFGVAALAASLPCAVDTLHAFLADGLAASTHAGAPQ